MGSTLPRRSRAKRVAPVVILTAFSQRDLVERARDAGAMAYLVKPFTISDLVPAIELATSRFAEISALEQEVARLDGSVGDPQTGRACQGCADADPGPVGTTSVQVDSAYCDGPPDHDEGGRRSGAGEPHAAVGRCGAGFGR